MKVTNRKLFAKADFLISKNLSRPRIKLSNSQTLFLDGVETGSLMSDFAQQLSCTNSQVPDFYFTLIVAAGKSQTLTPCQKPRLERKLGPVQT